MNARVGAYASTCEALAARIARSQAARQVGAEYDDLVQEGLIHVWLSLERGAHPSTEMIENRMKDWIRTCRFQLEGRSRPEAVGD